jgi:pseudouridine-5'-phosphate glycosidase
LTWIEPDLESDLLLGNVPVDQKGVNTMPTRMKISPTLQSGAHAPVVALESTVISHGLPYPANLETALQLQEIVRSQGVREQLDRWE